MEVDKFRLKLHEVDRTRPHRELNTEYCKTVNVLKEIRRIHQLIPMLRLNIDGNLIFTRPSGSTMESNAGSRNVTTGGNNTQQQVVTVPQKQSKMQQKLRAVKRGPSLTTSGQSQPPSMGHNVLQHAGFISPDNEMVMLQSSIEGLNNTIMTLQDQLATRQQQQECWVDSDICIRQTDIERPATAGNMRSSALHTDEDIRSERSLASSGSRSTVPMQQSELPVSKRRPVKTAIVNQQQECVTERRRTRTPDRSTRLHEVSRHSTRRRNSTTPPSSSDYSDDDHHQWKRHRNRRDDNEVNRQGRGDDSHQRRRNRDENNNRKYGHRRTSQDNDGRDKEDEEYCDRRTDGHGRRRGSDDSDESSDDDRRRRHRKRSRSSKRRRGEHRQQGEATPKSDRSESSKTRRRLQYIKPEKYDGSTCVETFLIKFKDAAKFNGWDSKSKASYLKACLIGDAGYLLWETEGKSYDEIIDKLRGRYGSKGQQEKFRVELKCRRRRPDETLQALACDLNVSSF